jgi:rhodanese-related sulfurtransferase
MSTPEETPLEVSCTEVRERLDRSDNLLLLDCREQQEFATVRIEGATLLPMSEIQQRVGELSEWKERPIVVYCHHGGRSLQVTYWLRQQGYLHTQSMAGGIDGWAVQIDPSLRRY